jgi:hypothetical protein
MCKTNSPLSLWDGQTLVSLKELALIIAQWVLLSVLEELLWILTTKYA